MSSNSPLVLVTGATGAVGPRVVQAAHEAGYRVRTLSRRPPSPTLLPQRTDVHLGDVTDRMAVAHAVEDVRIIVHLAALLHAVNPSAAVRTEYERVNVSGTHALVDAALRAGVERLVFFSSIAVYGHTPDRVLTERSRTGPDTLYAQTKLEAESIVLAARHPDGQPLGTVLRLAAVYGPRIKGNYRRLLQSLARGRFIPIGDGRNRRTLVYDKDVARISLFAAQHPAAAGQVFNVTDGQLHTVREIIAAMCAALGRNPPLLSLPLGPTRLAAGMLEDACRMTGRQSPIGRATVDKYTEDIAASAQRIHDQLGCVPQYDLLSGWTETVAEMRSRGEL